VIIISAAISSLSPLRRELAKKLAAKGAPRRFSCRWGGNILPPALYCHPLSQLLHPMGGWVVLGGKSIGIVEKPQLIISIFLSAPF